MINERQKSILAKIKDEGEVRLSNLKLLFPDLSEMTLRRDLDILCKENLAERTHGGAKLQKCSSFNSALNTVDKYASYNRIVQTALRFIEEDRSIFFDAGSMLFDLAAVTPDIRLFAITNAPNISMEFMKRNNAEIILLGGSINKSTMSASGLFTINHIDSLNIDIAFVNGDSFSLECGFTNAFFNECELKRKVIKAAKKVIVLLEHSRLNRSLPFTFAALEDVDVLVTDGDLPEDISLAAAASNVEVVF